MAGTPRRPRTRRRVAALWALPPFTPNTRGHRGARQRSSAAGGLAMNFTHPWVLLLALLPIAWAAVEWRTSSRRPALLLKAATFLLIALALSEPRLSFQQ